MKKIPRQTKFAFVAAVLIAIGGLCIILHAKHMWETTNDTYGMETLMGGMMILAAPGIFLAHKENPYTGEN